MTHRTAHPARHPHAGHLSRSDRDETAARQVKGIPWGGIECQAQSERPKRDPRRSIKASKVAANLFGRMQPRQGQSDGAAPASKIAEAWGPTSANAGAGRPMPSAQALTIQQVKEHNIRGKKGMNAQTKIPSALHRIIPSGDEKALAYFMPSQAMVDNKRCGLAPRPDHSRMAQGPLVKMSAEARASVRDILSQNPGQTAAEIAVQLDRSVDYANKVLNELLAFRMVKRTRSKGNRGSFRYEVAQ